MSVILICFADSFLTTIHLGVTENFLEIPTIFRYGGLEIKLGGNVKFSVSFKSTEEGNTTLPWR